MSDYTPSGMGSALIHEIADRDADRCDVQKCLNLIAHGAQLNYSYNDRTVLEWAVIKGHDEITLAILDRTQDNPHFTQTRTAATLLHVAAFQDRPAIVTELIKRGAALDTQDKDGQTPLHLACLWQRVECAKLLIDAGADLTIENGNGSIAQDYAALRKQPLIVQMIIDAPEKRREAAIAKALQEKAAAKDRVKRGTVVQEKPVLIKPIKLKPPRF